MKRIFKITLTFLAIFSLFFIFFAQVPTSNAQGQVNTANYNYTNIAGTDINATITTNVGILTDGGISIWNIVPKITTNLSVSTVIVRGIINGSKFERGFTFPSTGQLNDDTQLQPIGGSLGNITFGEYFSSMQENLLLFPDIYGIPNSFTFNLSIYISTPISNQTIYLTSGDSPLITIIFRNPEASSEIGDYFFTLLYILPFVIPITVIVIFIVSNKLREKKKKAGGNKHET